MLKSLLLPLLAGIASIFLVASNAHAHKLRVFAYENGGQILVEAAFNSGRPAKDAEVTVEAADGKMLVTGKTDAAGAFAFAVPDVARSSRLDLTIIADAGEGHRGTWLLQAADFLDEVPTASHQGTTAPQAAAPAPLTPAQVKQDISVDYKQIEAIVAKVVERELASVKRLLAQEKERQVSLQDIIGGLGYIFGIAGIIAYFKSRN